ncbi:MAG: DedA family protein [Chloroflexota bacterium]
MVQLIQDTIEAIGYLGIGLLTIIENIIPPIPSEIILPFSGFTARRSDLTLVGVIAAGTIGSILGALILYYVGHRLGEERVIRLTQKYGHHLGIEPENVRRANDWFRNNGQWAVFICRLIPGLRSVISIPAGTARMNLFTFLFWTSLGTLLWTALLGVTGYALGDNYQAIQPIMDVVSWVVTITLIVLAIRWIWQRRTLLRSQDDAS